MTQYFISLYCLLMTKHSANLYKLLDGSRLKGDHFFDHFFKSFFSPILFLASIFVSRSLLTVNSEIFGRVLLSRNFAGRKIRENKTHVKWQKHSVVY